MRRRLTAATVVLVLAALAAASRGGPTPTRAASATASPTPTATVHARGASAAAQAPGPAAAPSLATATQAAPPTATHTATPALTATATPVPPTPTPITSPTSTTVPSVPGGAATQPPTPTRTPTRAPSVSSTPTRVPTSTAVATATIVATASPTPTRVLSPSPTLTPTVKPPPVTPLVLEPDVVSITRSGVTVTWTSSAPASSYVDYGLTAFYGAATPIDPSVLTTHALVMTGLQPGTTYHYRITNMSPTGGLGRSADLTFTTGLAGTGPDIESVSSPRVTSTSALVRWTTDTGMVAQVEYGPTANYGLFTLLSTFPSPAQDLTLFGLQPERLYHYRIKGWDSSGYLAASGDFTFTTAPAGQAVLVGGQTLEPRRATLAPGQATTYQYVATATGLASQLRLYVDQGSTSSVVRAAVYTDVNGAPGDILTQGSLATPQPGWNTIPLPPTQIVLGGRYWIAVLSPIGSGNLAVRDAGVGGSSQTSVQTTLAAFPATWTPGVPSAFGPLTASLMQVPPSVSLTAPDDGATVAGTLKLAALVDDDQAVLGVQFLVDGVPVGAPVRTSPYVLMWDSSTASGTLPHVVTVRATDALGRTSTSAPVSVSIDAGPSISLVAASPGPTSSSQRIDWTTDVSADGQVEYGPTPNYGSSTPVDGRVARPHTAQLTGLAPGTIYHYRVKSRDAMGGLSASADFTFTTPTVDDAT